MIVCVIELSYRGIKTFTTFTKYLVILKRFSEVGQYYRVSGRIVAVNDTLSLRRRVSTPKEDVPPSRSGHIVKTEERG